MPAAGETQQADWEREFWLQRRQAILIELAAIEKRLGLDRSRPKRQRDARRCEGDAESRQEQPIA